LAHALFARGIGLPHALYLGSARRDFLQCRKLSPA
jgi:hypothetical protein